MANPLIYLAGVSSTGKSADLTQAELKPLEKPLGSMFHCLAETQTDCCRLTGFLNVSSLAKFSFQRLERETGLGESLTPH